jgi:hypothetical protein
MDFQPISRQLARHDIRSSLFLESQFGVGVDVAPDRLNISNERNIVKPHL